MTKRATGGGPHGHDHRVPAHPSDPVAQPSEPFKAPHYTQSVRLRKARSRSRAAARLAPDPGRIRRPGSGHAIATASPILTASVGQATFM